MLKFQEENLKIINKWKSRLCLECQECCKVIIIPHTDKKLLSPRSIEFWESRGCTVIEEPNKHYILIPFVCPHLTPEGCSIYETRPQICRDYDGRETKHQYIRDKCKWNEINMEE